MGKRIPLSNGRRLVDDVIRMARGMPMASLYRDLELREIATLRKKIRPRVSWNVIFMKAYAIVAAKTPELRSCYVAYPWPHLYVHEHNVCMITVGREYQGETRLLFARFNNPDQLPLELLEKQLDGYRDQPVEDFKQFRHQISFAKVPSIARRLIWSLMFNWCPRKKSSNMGTFGMSLSKYKGSCSDKLLGPGTGLIGVDLLPRKGVSRFLFTFDHRILDGIPAVEVVDQVYKAINGPIKNELEAMIARQGATNSNSENSIADESAQAA